MESAERVTLARDLAQIGAQIIWAATCPDSTHLGTKSGQVVVMPRFQPVSGQVGAQIGLRRRGSFWAVNLCLGSQSGQDTAAQIAAQTKPAQIVPR